MIYFLLTQTKDILQSTSLNLVLTNTKQEPKYNKLLQDYVNSTKTEIDNHTEQWDVIKKYTNPYEFIHTIVPGYKTSVSKKQPLSRAYFKMIEICNVFKLCETKYFFLNTFHLAEGPGGFIEAVVDIRQSNVDMYIGMTLEDNDTQTPGWKKSQEFIKKHHPCIFIEKGEDLTGNLYNPCNFKYVYDKYKSTQNLVTADGGFDFSSDFNNQEQTIMRLLYTEVCYALMLQKEEGHFVLKMFDLFLKSSVDILYILSLCYEEVYIMKPSTSRSANSEKYVVCKYLKNINKEELFHVFYDHLQELNKPENKNMYISDLLNISINQLYINDIKEINSILGQNQLESINSTLILIEQAKKKEKLDNLVKQNILNSISWCEENKVPFYKDLIETNIFLQNKE